MLPCSGSNSLSVFQMRVRAFTLVELLITLAVLAILVAIIIPTVGSVRDRSLAVQSTANLRQIGQVAALYITESQGVYPTWRTWTDGSGSWVWDQYGNRPDRDGTASGGILPYMMGYHEGGLMTRDDYNAPGSPNTFNCPANESTTSARGYAANQRVMRDPPRTIGGEFRESTALYATDFLNPGNVVMITSNSMEFNNRRWFNLNNWEDTIGFHRHRGRAAILFGDFSVRMVSREELTEENIEPQLAFEMN